MGSSFRHRLTASGSGWRLAVPVIVGAAGAALGCGQMYQAPGPGAASQEPAPATTPEPRAPGPTIVAKERPPDGAPLPPGAMQGADIADITAASARKPRPAAAPAGDTAAFLQAHNQLRKKHCAAPLTWSPRLAQVAQQWANTMRDKDCMFGHSNGDFGENLAAGTSGTLDPGKVVQMWYDEVSLYKFPDGGFSMKTGHFTQVVWRGTKQVGCGRSQCKGMDLFVCEYDPPGNWERQYRQNVLPTSCR